MDFWGVVGFFFWSWALICYLMVLVWILGDLFRDDELSGWLKAVWVIFLVFVPFLTALVYLIVRGASMNTRAGPFGRDRAVVPEDYSRPAPSATPAADISHARALLEAGTINQGEFDALKAKAMGSL